jgi:hypothetical protein
MTESAATDTQAAPGLCVINLRSSSMPMPLDVPFRHELDGFTVFRSRAVEDGRERFRLHLGYFDTQQHAEEALAVVRKYYPGAWISPPPGHNLGSLDDTSRTEFSSVRSVYARVVKRRERAPAPTPVGTRVLASQFVRAPDSAPPKLTEPVAAAPPQRYAVQLDWSEKPIVAGEVARLAIFDAYNLYTLRISRDGAPQYGLRLGFFSSADAARRVAEYVRSEFPGVGIVPVSHREYGRAVEVMRKRALKVVAKKEEHPVPLSTGESALQQAPAGVRAPIAPTAPAAPAPKVRAIGTYASPPPKLTREELLLRLGAYELKIDKRPP